MSRPDRIKVMVSGKNAHAAISYAMWLCMFVNMCNRDKGGPGWEHEVGDDWNLSLFRVCSLNNLSYARMMEIVNGVVPAHRQVKFKGDEASKKYVNDNTILPIMLEFKDLPEMAYTYFPWLEVWTNSNEIEE